MGGKTAVTDICGARTRVMTSHPHASGIHLCSKPKDHGPEIQPPREGFYPVQQHACACGAEWSDQPWALVADAAAHSLGSAPVMKAEPTTSSPDQLPWHKLVPETLTTGTKILLVAAVVLFVLWQLGSLLRLW